MDTIKTKSAEEVYGGVQNIPHICNYCNDRHFSCDGDSNAAPCAWFKLGKCFNCAVRRADIANGGDGFVEGICDDTYDYGGCDNYKE